MRRVVILLFFCCFVLWEHLAVSCQLCPPSVLVAGSLSHYNIFMIMGYLFLSGVNICYFEGCFVS